MKARLLALCLIGCTAVAQAQVTPFEIGVGWAQSGSFEKDTGGRGRLEGPEFSISQSILRLPFVGDARIGFSALLGGQARSGSDADGNVYRVFARYHTPAAGGGVYGIVGAHYAWGKARNGEFEDVNRIGGDIGIGMALGGPAPVLPKAAIEFVSYQSARAQTRGWSISAKIRL